MMKLIDDPKFKADYNKYKELILQIEDKGLQTELSEMLTQFRAAVASIDLHHDSLMTTGRMPEGVSESREKISRLKSQLDKRLKFTKKP